MTNTRRAITLFRRHRRAIGLTLALLVLTLCAGVALLGVSGGFLTATALTLGSAVGFNYFAPSAGIRGLTLMRIVARYFERLVGHAATLTIGRDLRVWFFARLLPLTPMQLGRLRNGDLMARLLGDIDDAEGLLVRAAGPGLALVLTTVLAVLAATWLHAPAGLLLATLASAAIATGLIGAGHGADQDEARRLQTRSRLRSHLHEACEGAAELHAFDATPRWLDRIDGEAAELAAIENRRQRRLCQAGVGHGSVVALGLPAMLWLLATAVAGETLDGARAAALFFLTLATLELSAASAGTWQAWRSARRALGCLDAIAGQAPSVPDPDAPVPVPMTGDLHLRAVRFAWPDTGQPVLAGLDLVLHPGERIAVHGDSGTGKSTLINLLLRSLAPDAGSLRFGGIDLRAMAQADWHARIAWLPQSAPVFAGSLRDNLAFGETGLDDAQLWSMLETMRLADWARQRDGLSTWLGEAGATVSAGQARRIALARTLLRAAPLVILDEPGEGLDHNTARQVFEALPAILGTQRSLILVSHDIPPAGLVHRRYRLDGGRLHAIAGDR